ncbi:PspA domain-containing protein [Gordonia sp. ABSL1-1]|uniref:PspA domain-containing protein n=1 Tax=Gordonia sp. ABSL1-1 TaxID=3053923 RepID=UPI00257441A1|nr:PspA domain-containing protein [Gordonia sp. ABSL1-1]MDL9938945.1 PspA domain-containing protein [Gordonia sp. ABSL1-1]
MSSPGDQTADDPTQSDAPEGQIIEGEVVDSSTQTPATPSGYLPPIPDPNYTESGVPTFDFVRGKIQNRIGTAIGSQELAEESPEGQQVDEMMRKRDEAAKKKLEEIRKSMGK